MKRTGHKGASVGGASTEHRAKRESVHEANLPEEEGVAAIGSTNPKQLPDDNSTRSSNTSDLFKKPLGTAPAALDHQHQQQLVGAATRSASDAASKRVLSRSHECLSGPATPPVAPKGSPLANQSAVSSRRSETGFGDGGGSTVEQKQSRALPPDASGTGAVLLSSPTSSPRLSAPSHEGRSASAAGANAAARAASLPSDSLHAVVVTGGNPSGTTATSPLVTTSSPSHTSAAAAGQQLPHTLCRVHLPDGSSSVISIQPQPTAAGSPDGLLSSASAGVTPVGGTTATSTGSNARVTVYDALRPLCERRGIDLSHCEILFCGTEKVLCINFQNR